MFTICYFGSFLGCFNLLQVHLPLNVWFQQSGQISSAKERTGYLPQQVLQGSRGKEKVIVKLYYKIIVQLYITYAGTLCFLKRKIFISFLIIKGSKAYIIQYRRFNKSPPNHPKIYILLYFLSDFFFSYYS